MKSKHNRVPRWPVSDKLYADILRVCSTRRHLLTDAEYILLNEGCSSWANNDWIDATEIDAIEAVVGRVNAKEPPPAPPKASEPVIYRIHQLWSDGSQHLLDIAAESASAALLIAPQRGQVIRGNTLRKSRVVGRRPLDAA